MSDWNKEKNHRENSKKNLSLLPHRGSGLIHCFRKFEALQLKPSAKPMVNQEAFSEQRYKLSPTSSVRRTLVLSSDILCLLSLQQRDNLGSAMESDSEVKRTSIV